MDGRVGFLSRLRVNSTVNSCCKLLRCPNVKLHGISLGLRVLSLSQWTPQVAFWTFNTWSSENLHKAIVTSIFGIHSCSPDISTAILLTSYIFNTSSYSTANVPASIKIYYQCCSYSLTSLICFPQRSALFGRIKTGTSRTWAWICPRGSGINSYIGINIRATSNLRNCGRHPTLHLILHQAGEKCLMAYHSPSSLFYQWSAYAHWTRIKHPVFRHDEICSSISLFNCPDCAYRTCSRRSRSSLEDFRELVYEVTGGVVRYVDLHNIMQIPDTNERRGG